MLESRILQIFTESGLTKTDFAHRIGISNAVLSHISSGRNKASTDLILTILTHFPDINPDWLLLGSGEMLRSSQTGISAAQKEELLEEMKRIHALNVQLGKQIEAYSSILEKLK